MDNYELKKIFESKNCPFCNCMKKTFETGYTIDQKGNIHLVCCCSCSYLSALVCPKCGLKTKNIQIIKRHYSTHGNEDLNEYNKLLKEKLFLKYCDLTTEEKNKKRKMNIDQENFTDYGMEDNLESDKNQESIDINIENQDFSSEQLTQDLIENENSFDNVIFEFLNENQHFEINNEQELNGEIEFESTIIDIEEYIKDFEFFESEQEIENLNNYNKRDFYINIKTDPVLDKNIHINQMKFFNLTEKIILEEILLFNISKDDTSEYLKNKHLLNKEINTEIPKNYYEICKLFEKINILKPKIIEKSVVNLNI
jgi:hypothetical protein